MSILRPIGYSFGAAMAASLSVLLVGLWMFGFPLTEWSEGEGRVVGVVGTLVGVAGAVVGLWIALRTDRHRVE